MVPLKLHLKEFHKKYIREMKNNPKDMKCKIEILNKDNGKPTGNSPKTC